jgi:hypothetical protein
MERLIAGMEKAGKDCEESAKQFAPVRKPRILSLSDPGSNSEQYPVRLKSGPSYRALTKTQQSLHAQIEEYPSSIKAFRHILTHASSKHKDYAAGQRQANRMAIRLAQLYTYSAGPMKGQSPGFLVEHGERVMGVTRPSDQGGHLRDSIHFLGVEVLEGKIRIRVKADAKYAWYVEKGFRHKGGTQIKQRPFLRRAMKEVVIPKLRNGEYFKG